MADIKHNYDITPVDKFEHYKISDKKYQRKIRHYMMTMNEYHSIKNSNILDQILLKHGFDFNQRIRRETSPDGNYIVYMQEYLEVEKQPNIPYHYYEQLKKYDYPSPTFNNVEQEIQNKLNKEKLEKLYKQMLEDHNPLGPPKINEDYKTPPPTPEPVNNLGFFKDVEIE